MNNSHFLAFIAIFLLLGASTNAQEKSIVQYLPPIQLHPQQSPRYINDSIRVFYTIDTLSGYDALNAIINGELQETQYKKSAGVNLADNGFWLLFKLKNTAEVENLYFLELAYNRTDLIKLFVVDNGTIQLDYETGDTFVYAQRPVDYRNFAFLLSFAANEEKVFLLNLEKRNTVDRYPLKIYTQDEFYRHKDKENIIYGLFFGIILLIVVASIGLSFYMRMPMFAFYGLYTLSVGLFLFTSLGLTFQVITPNLPNLNYNNLGVLVPISVIFMILFCQAFFNTKKYFSLINKFYNFLTLNLLLLLLIWAFAADVYQTYAVAILNYTYVIILSVFVLAFLTAHLFRNINYTNAILFGLGYLASFTGIGYAILIDTGLVYSSLFTDSSLSIISGIFIEFIFLTSAMAVYIRRKIRYFDFNAGFQSSTPLTEKDKIDPKTSELQNENIIETYSLILETLTSREKEVLQLIANGKTSQEIAESLYLSIHTVQTHRKHIWKKLGIKSFNELIKIAAAFELISEN